MAAPPKLDFRFADEEDAQDIAAIVNAAFALETCDAEGSEPALAFRTVPRLGVEGLEQELQFSRNTRWLILETPMPDERLVAVAAVQLVLDMGGIGETQVGLLSVLAVAPSMQKKGIGSQLLRRCEAVCLNLHCGEMRCDVPVAREDVLVWLANRNFNEHGGGLWDNLSTVKAVTRYVTLKKDLTAGLCSAAGSISTSAPRPAPAPAAVSGGGGFIPGALSADEQEAAIYEAGNMSAAFEVKSRSSTPHSTLRQSSDGKSNGRTVQLSVCSVRLSLRGHLRRRFLTRHHRFALHSSRAAWSVHVKRLK